MYTKKKIKYKMNIETLNYIQLNYKQYNFFRVNHIICIPLQSEKPNTDYQ